VDHDDIRIPRPLHHLARVLSRGKLGWVWLARSFAKLVKYGTRDGRRAFFEPQAVYPWVSEVERSWPVIRRELESVLEHKSDIPAFQEVSPHQVAITSDSLWRSYFFRFYGYRAEDNCRRCPETAKLIESLPGVTSAFFSILEPGKRIPPHTGPHKGVLRYHLGVIVPESTERCAIRVKGEVRPWTEGGSLVFDDWFEHEAWNESEGVRVVLFLDVVRPLPFPLSWLNRFVLDAIRELTARQLAVSFALLMACSRWILKKVRLGSDVSVS